ncbi:NAD-dependent epimerase/dehydratase family protein [Alkalihalobacillus sp. NPDC078783]
MRRAVVLGGLGFIGFHLCQELLENGVEVVCIEKQDPHAYPELDEKLMYVGRNASFEWMLGDLDDKDERMYAKLKEADTVFHMASPVSLESKWQLKNQTVQQATKWIQTICQSMKKDAMLIFPSTVEVYGDVPGLITEETPPQPTSPYGLIKYELEQSIAKEAVAHQLRYAILRLPTVYGPWQRADMTFAQLLNNEEEIYQDRSTLDALFVTDAVKGFVQVAGQGDQSSMYHLTSGKRDQWFIGAKQLGAGEELLKASQTKSSLSPKKAEEHLQFRPDISIEEGIRQQEEHVQKRNRMR